LSDLPEGVKGFVNLLHANGEVKDILNEIFAFIFKENEEKKPKKFFMDFLIYLLGHVDDYSTQTVMSYLQKYANDNGVESVDLLREYYYVGTEVTKFISMNFKPPLCKEITCMNLAGLLEIIRNINKTK